MTICLLPGLGYDCRIFDNLDLDDFKLIKLNWIEPLKNEHINQYAKRLFHIVEPIKEPIICIAHSMGGMIAQEIASIRKVNKIILISSIKSRPELPRSFKMVKPLKLDLFFNKEICINTVNFWGAKHGFTTLEDKALFKSMLGKQTNQYLRWALRTLSEWQTPKTPADTVMIHIHGTADKTLPYRLVKKPDYTIENGSHICVWKRADEISKIIRQII